MAAVDPVGAITAGVAASASISAPEEEAGKQISRFHTNELDEVRDVAVAAPGYDSLISAESWEDLSLKPELVRGVLNAKWERPSKIQAKALPIILNAKRPNLLAQSKNGSGKTGAFGLAMLQVVEPALHKVQAICMAPTRELAVQTTKRLQEIAAFLPGIAVVTVIGGVMYNEAVTQHVVVATPGKTCQLVKSRLLDLSAVKLFVVDEADDMILNFIAEMRDIKKAVLRRPTGAPPPQVLLFSASFECLKPAHPCATTARDFTDELLERKRRDVAVILASSVEELRVENVTHFVAKLPLGADAFKAKLDFITSVYDMLNVGKAMIFVDKRDSAKKLADDLRAIGHAPAVTMGGKTTEMSERTKVQHEFETGVTKVLICTDVMNRGIDIPNLQLVINFDLPFEYDAAAHRHGGPDFATFQHRCGRVGRMGSIGACIHLVAGEADWVAVNDMCAHFKLALHELPANPLKAATLVEKSLKTPLGTAAAAMASAAPAAAPAAAAGAGTGTGGPAAAAVPRAHYAPDPAAGGTVLLQAALGAVGK